MGRIWYRPASIVSCHHGCDLSLEVGMALEESGSRPGLWINPQWHSGRPGTFAIVMGVSVYSHLSGAARPEDEAPETYGLGQLAVSALTAFRFFEWLRHRYRNPSAPIAKCWLLLSPTLEEGRVAHEIDGYRT